LIEKYQVSSTRYRRAGLRRAAVRSWRYLVLGTCFLLSGCADAAPRPEAAHGGEAAVAATDDSGREVRLARPARRVVSLLPAATGTLFALGAGDRVVGRTRYDDEPHLAHLPSVGGGLDPSVEALVALRPDLVLAWEGPGGSPLRQELDALGIPVFGLATRDTAAIYANVRRLGRLTGRDAAADSVSAAIRARLEAVRASVPPGPRPRVLYVVGIDPPFIAGTDNFISELIGVAGGDPVPLAAELRGASPQVSREALVRLRPDVVVLPVQAGDDDSLERLRREPGWRDVPAVREGRVATVPADLVSQPGPRIAEMAEALAAAIRRAHGAR
jgi:iron complex transport system substrate-binding protein